MGWLLITEYKTKKAEISAFFLFVVFVFLSATAAGFAIPAAFFALFARRGVDRTRIVSFRLPLTIGTNHHVGVNPDQFFKAFSAFLAFVL